MKDAKTIIIIFLLVILSVLVVGSGVYFWQQAKIKELQSTFPTPTPTTQVNLAPTTIPAKPSIPMSTIPSKTDEEMIKETFSAKYSKPTDQINININRNTGTHASGGIGFEGEMGGGMWFAAHVDEKWIIVYDGHGTIPCEDIEPYNFPVDMIPECWDQSTGKLITR